MTKIILFFAFFSVLLMLTGCDMGNDEPIDRHVTTSLFISDQTGNMIGLMDEPFECMLIQEKGQKSWNTLPFDGIKGFSYEKGYFFELLVSKTIYGKPAADGNSFTYELIKIIAKEDPNQAKNTVSPN